MHSDMPTDTTDEHARRFVDALQSLERDGESTLEAMVALFSPDATLTNAALKQAHTVRAGHDGVRAFWSEYARTFRGAHTTFRQVTLSDNAVGLFWSTRGAGTASPLDYDGATLLELDDGGAIARFHGYYDTRELTV